jgi:hypothetical protein
MPCDFEVILIASSVKSDKEIIAQASSVATMRRKLLSQCEVS